MLYFTINTIFILYYLQIIDSGIKLQIMTEEDKLLLRASYGNPEYKINMRNIMNRDDVKLKHKIRQQLYLDEYYKRPDVIARKEKQQLQLSMKRNIIIKYYTCPYCGASLKRYSSEFPKYGMTFCNRDHRRLYYLLHPELESPNKKSCNTLEHKRKMSEIMTIVMNKPHVKNKTCAAMRETWQNQDTRQKHIISQIKVMNRPEVKAKIKETKNKPDVKAKAKRSAQLSWENPKIFLSRMESRYGGIWYGNVDDYECDVIAHEIRSMLEYQHWRKEIFKRDKFKDFFTGESRVGRNQFEAHHIKLFSTILKENNIQTVHDAINCKELWDIDNGVTMLKSNHTPIFHKFIKDKYKNVITITDFTDIVKNDIRGYLKEN